MIEIHQVSKQFAKRPAVVDLNLSVPTGEIFGMLGHNGAGKSTTIGMLLGQVWPDRGQLRIAGHDVARERTQALARVGAIFESPVFYDYLSGWRNLEILSGYTAATPPARIREVIEWVGLSGREHGKVRTYSHGMRARLALAQALLPNPNLLILDEPTDGLDPEGIHEMRGTIRRLHEELKLTILLSSHLLSEVEQLCHRIAVMHQGRLVFCGTLEQVRETQNWTRLETDQFEFVCNQLMDQKLIERFQGPDRITLAPQVRVQDIAKVLVANNHPIHALHPQNQTLEDFYLDLTRAQTAQSSKTDNDKSPAPPQTSPPENPNFSALS
jgi:ABC-2 type transport system ATP-binding protein